MADRTTLKYLPTRTIYLSITSWAIHCTRRYSTRITLCCCAVVLLLLLLLACMRVRCAQAEASFVRNPGVSLGFSVAGGTGVDQPFRDDDDVRFYVLVLSLFFAL